VAALAKVTLLVSVVSKRAPKVPALPTLIVPLPLVVPFPK
jgi:hypothetical protein